MKKIITLQKSEVLILYSYLFQAFRSIDRSLNTKYTNFDKFYEKRIKSFVLFFEKLSIEKSRDFSELEIRFSVWRWFRKLYYYCFSRSKIGFKINEWMYIQNVVEEIIHFVMVEKNTDAIDLRMKTTYALGLIEYLYLPRKHLKIANYIESNLHPFHLEKLTIDQILDRCGFRTMKIK